MSIGLIFENPTVTETQYDQVMKEVFPGNKMPDGMLYHVAGSSPTGWRVIEVWNSQASADLFLKEKLGDALQRANITVQPQSFEVHNIANV